MLTSLRNSGDYPDALALIAAIRANPLDNTARLVFADWLDEREGIEGCKEWAELIRLQCSPAATCPVAFFDGGGSQEEYANTHRRIAELGPEVAEMSGMYGRTLSHRGFLLRPLNPRTVTSNSVQNCMEQEPGWLGLLELLGCIDLGPELNELAASGSLANVTALDLCQSCIRGHGVQELAQLENLRVLDLGSNQINAPQHLAPLASLADLSFLGLAGNLLQAVGVSTLAQYDNLSSLTGLSLAYTGLGNPGAAALATCHNFRNLTYLDLSGTGIGHPVAMRSLAACQNLRNVATLILENNYLNALNTAPLRNAIITGTLPDGTKGEAFPCLQHVRTGDPAMDQLFADALAVRARRLAPQLDVTANEINQAAAIQEVQ